MKKIFLITFLITSISYGQLLGIVSDTGGAIITSNEPVLSNFHIDNDTPTHVEFDSSTNITGITTTGFVISGKTISNVTIDSDGLGGYFTISVPFTFWDNNTIRLGENDDTSDRQTTLHNFTLSYIENNIVEPSASTYRYVTTVASGGGNGLTEGTAWTVSEATSNASAGMTIWVKAGNYGFEHFVSANNGTINSPIKFIGYKTTIGDITSNYFDYGVTWSTSEMPTFTGASTLYSDTAFYMEGSFTILRNFQSSGYGSAIQEYDSNLTNIVIENFNSKDNYHATDANFSAILFNRNTGLTNLRFKNLVLLNSSMNGLTIQGDAADFNLIENVKSYNDRTDSTERQDYHITMNGNNTIIRNCYIENFNSTSTNGGTHGIGMKATGNVVDNNYNLIELSTAVNIQEGFYFRNYRCDYNVVKDCTASNNNTVTIAGEDSGGIWLWGGVHYNIFERVTVEDVAFGIGLYDNEESPEWDEVGTDNIVRNCTFNNVRYGVYGVVISAPANSPFANNKFYNNTFNNINWFWRNTGNLVLITNLEFTNNIVSNVGATYDTPTGFVFINNDFFNTSTWADSYIGSNGNIDIDPKFTEVSTGDFSLSSETPATVYEGGAILFGAEYDYAGRQRTSAYSIGAFEKDAEDVYPDYFISSAGDDINDGLTEASAWKTMAKVETEITSADAGKVIAFKKGDTWNERLYLNNVDGTSGNEIIFTSYGNGDKPIIKLASVGTLVWTNIGGNIWRNTTVTAPPERVEVDATERLGGDNMNYSQLGTNVPDLVEWWWGDNGDSNDYFYFYSVTDPNSFSFSYNTSAQSRSLLLIKSDYVTFHNIEFQYGYGTSVTVYGCDNVKFDNCDIGYMSSSGIQYLYYVDTHCSNATIENCLFDTRFEFDYSSLGTYSTAENTGAADGIYTRSLKNGVFRNNVFKNWGHSTISISSQGIESNGYVSHDIKIHNNTFDQSKVAYGRPFGISGNSYNVEIYNNDFDNSAAPLQVNGYNNHLHHNIIRNSRHSTLKLYQQAALVLQGYALFANDNIVENNLFIDNQNAGFGIDGYHASCNVENNIFRNNILYNCGIVDNGLSIDLKIDEAGGFDAINNNFYNNDIYSSSTSNTINDNNTLRTVSTWNGTTTKGNTVTDNISGDPDFVNPLSDWHLNTGSPAINTGTPTLSTIDYYGQTMSVTSPDIGISDNN